MLMAWEIVESQVTELQLRVLTAIPPTGGDPVAIALGTGPTPHRRLDFFTVRNTLGWLASKHLVARTDDGLWRRLIDPRDLFDGPDGEPARARNRVRSVHSQGRVRKGQVLA